MPSDRPEKGKKTHGLVTYTDEMAELICRRIASGETLKGVCRTEGYPPESTVRNWVLDDREGFSARYARAREMQVHSWVDDIVEVSDDGTNDWMAAQEDGPDRLNHEHVQRSKLRVDTRKWLASKVMPKVYGDRVIQEHTIDDLRAKPRDELERELAQLRANSRDQDTP